MPPSTSSSTTMSALPRPYCGSLAKELSILTIITGWFGVFAPLTGRPVNGQSAARVVPPCVGFDCGVVSAAAFLLDPQPASTRLAVMATVIPATAVLRD